MQDAMKLELMESLHHGLGSSGVDRTDVSFHLDGFQAEVGY